MTRLWKFLTSGRRVTITVDQAGKAAFILALGYIAFILCFVLWAALERGTQ